MAAWACYRPWSLEELLSDLKPMTENEGVVRGSCQCGGIQYEYNGDIIRFSLDHCARCQKSTGSAFAVWIVGQRPGFRWITGEELVRRYVAPVRETPPGYTRTFCSVGGPAPYVDESIVGLARALWINGSSNLRCACLLITECRGSRSGMPCQFGSGPRLSQIRTIPQG
jgi:hypothetical protein